MPQSQGSSDQPAGPDVSVAARRRRVSRRPDARLILGVALVLVSVVVGSRLLAESTETTPMWSVRSPIAAGTTLTTDDLRAVDVSLGGVGEGYVPVTESLVGVAVSRNLSAGELVPAAGVTEHVGGRLVSVPVDSDHAPSGLRRGHRIDVFATYDAGTAAARTELVLEGVPVQDVQEGVGALATSAPVGVVVAVAPEDVVRVVRAVQSAQLDISRVMEGS